MATRTMTARDLMTAELVTVADTTPVRELAELMVDRQISGIPVEDEGGELVGLVSLSDVAAVATRGSDFVPDQANPSFFVGGWEDRLDASELRYLHVEDEGLLARDVMTPKIYTIAADTPVAQVARTMLSGPLHRLLVTDQGRVVGIVSTLDLVKLLAE